MRTNGRLGLFFVRLCPTDTVLAETLIIKPPQAQAFKSQGDGCGLVRRVIVMGE